MTKSGGQFALASPHSKFRGTRLPRLPVIFAHALAVIKYRALWSVSQTCSGSVDFDFSGDCRVELNSVSKDNSVTETVNDDTSALSLIRLQRLRRRQIKML